MSNLRKLSGLLHAHLDNKLSPPSELVIGCSARDGGVCR